MPLPVERVPLEAELSASQLICAKLVGLGLNYTAIAEHLHIARSTAIFHVNEAAKKIPGDLPPQTKVGVWARGGSLDVLLGQSLREEMIDATFRRMTRKGRRGVTDGRSTPQRVRIAQSNGHYDVTATERGR
jgi:DNA-binding CsgD family transcriptional regulator